MTRIHKRPARFPQLIAAALFLAVCAYAGAALYSRLWPGQRTVPALPASICQTLSLEGLALRWEQTVTSPEEPALLAQAGRRIPAGGSFAVQADGSLLCSQRPAVFFPETDGYEDLSPALLEGMNAQSLRALLSRPPQPAENACGRLVTGVDWYFAALAETDAPPAAGLSCTLRFPQRSGEIPARLMWVSQSRRGTALLIFRLTVSDPDLLSLRRTAAELTLARVEGLAVPAAALREDETGQPYVNILSDSGPCRCPVQILYRDPEQVIAALSRQENALRPGSLILVPAPEPMQ